MEVMTDRLPLRAVMPAPSLCRIRKQPKRPKQHFVQFPEGFGDSFSAVGSISGWEGGFAPGHASGVAPSLGAAPRSGCVNRSAAAHHPPQGTPDRHLTGRFVGISGLSHAFAAQHS